MVNSHASVSLLQVPVTHGKSVPHISGISQKSVAVVLKGHVIGVENSEHTEKGLNDPATGGQSVSRTLLKH